MVNSVFPDFELPSTGNKVFRFSDLTDKFLVIYIYPKFSALGCAVYGVARDSLKSHDNFKAKQHEGARPRAGNFGVRAIPEIII